MDTLGVKKKYYKILFISAVLSKNLQSPTVGRAIVDPKVGLAAAGGGVGRMAGDLKSPRQHPFQK